jgi:hypothetical protein
MTESRHIKHQFVEYIPEILEPETLYISVEYATCSHLCLCGCGERVVTPLAPTEWQLTYDGDTVSLRPSIGNWSFDCQSHYWITRNRVRWAERWTRQKIETNRSSDRRRKQSYYEDAEANSLDHRDAVAGWPRSPVLRLPAWLRRGN